MSAEIINLRRARKAKKRRDAEAEASENRIRFGRTKAERQQQGLQSELEQRRIDGARRLPRDEDPSDGEA